MQSRELDIKPELNVILKSDTEVLDEVVVTGYGVTKKSTFTGAANVAGSTTLESRTDANFMKALEGSMPGVQMNNSTSMPGAQANVYIRGESSGASDNGRGTQYNSNTTTITWTNTLNWLYTFNEKHNVSVMLGQEAQWKNYWNEEYAGINFPLMGYRELNMAGSSYGIPSYKTRKARLASFLLNTSYDYQGKYYGQVSYRRDGSSVFGSNNRWSNFWSVGGKWRISEEEFLKDNDVFTNLAIRASYGTVGNQDIDWYASRGFYKAGYNYNNEPGIAPESLNLPDLGWETSKKLNIGLDITLIRKWNLTVDFYNEATSDMLFELPISKVTGLDKVYQNIGSMRNRGVEIGLNGTILQTKGWTWTAYANVTFNQNRVTELSDGKPVEETYTIIQEDILSDNSIW